MKTIDSSKGNWSKGVVNADETMDSTKQLVAYVTNELHQFLAENRVITSLDISVNYCNTDKTAFDGYSTSIVAAKVSEELSKNLLTWENSCITVDGNTVVYDDCNDTLRERLVKYLDIVCSRGMMNKHQYERFSSTLYRVYELLTLKPSDDKAYVNETVIAIQEPNLILNRMQLPYCVKYFSETLACPDEFYKLVKIDDKSADPIDDADAKTKLDEFIKRWFKSGKIYDKDRDEFYTEFATLYESISKTSDGSEAGMIPVRRSTRSKRVMGMKPLFNYVEINEILHRYGLNYNITYKQEHEPDGDTPKRRNALALKE